MTAPGAVFSKKNLTAWCIVPFDSKHRTPEERAQMLVRLGITQFAYDWREVHVASFDAEMDALKKYHITLSAFWMPYGPDPVSNLHYQAILDLLSRHHLTPQLWWSYGSSDSALNLLDQEGKVKRVAGMVAAMAKDAAKIGCTIGLYGHNGWFGEPENELEVLKAVNLPNTGLVYNFNHAEGQTERFASFLPTILAHLIALNIAGVQKGSPDRIVPVGNGNREQEMIRVVAESGYTGPIGIINEDTDPDAEKGLLMNMDGLKNILVSLGYKKTARTYE